VYQKSPALTPDGKPSLYLIRLSDGANVPPDNPEYLSWLRAGGVVREADIPTPPPVTEVTPAQAKVALFNAGLLDTAELEISTSYMPIKIYWANASTFDLNHPYIKGVGALLGLSDETMAELFTKASRL